jgi:hypothetical protein
LTAPRQRFVPASDPARRGASAGAGSVKVTLAWWGELLTEAGVTTAVARQTLLAPGRRPPKFVAAVRRHLVRCLLQDVGPGVARQWLQVVTQWSRKTLDDLVGPGHGPRGLLATKQKGKTQ